MGTLLFKCFHLGDLLWGELNNQKAHKQAKLLSVQLSIIESQTISVLTFQDAQVFASLIIWYLFECFLLLTVSSFEGKQKDRTEALALQLFSSSLRGSAFQGVPNAAYSQRAHQGVNYAWELPGCTAVRGVSSSPHVSSEKQL